MRRTQLKLHIKLLLYFSLLALIVLVAGGSGVLFVHLIKQHFSTLEEKISPINENAQEIANIASSMHMLSYQGGSAGTLDELEYIREWMIDEE
ncbi:MAG: hypothetical protein HRU15_07210, partial [Planctomycetes bacterium]|nr:hypothetical protein [Planctomycetota bacterium]